MNRVLEFVPAQRMSRVDPETVGDQDEVPAGLGGQIAALRELPGMDHPTPPTRRPLRGWRTTPAQRIVGRDPRISLEHNDRRELTPLQA
ncbi:hypothetical protein [Nocardia sp. NPDC057440]|uniref:hypothetical protein n=1 Tax=Nocardia sp. NPDC057440 TaxID=3346134 RepID=UPI00366A6CA3